MTTGFAALEQIVGLFLTIIEAGVTIGDSIARLLQILFEAVGLSLSLDVWRVVTILVSLFALWRIYHTLNITLKIALIFIIACAILGIVGLSFFGDGLFKGLTGIGVPTSSS